MCRLGLFILLAVICPAGPPIRAQDAGKALDRQVRALVKQLGAKEFARRQAARKELMELGEAVVPILDRMPAPSDLEVKLRLRKIRYELVGFAKDLDDALAAMPTGGEDDLRAELSPELAGVVAANGPRAGARLLKYILNPKSPFQRRAVNALVHSFRYLSAAEIDAYFRHALVLESKARAEFPQGVSAAIGMHYLCRYGWNGWPRGDTFDLKTTTRHFLDGQEFGKPYRYQGPMASTGRLFTKDLSLGRHDYYFTVEYEFVHQGTKIHTRLRSRDFTFAMIAASAPDELLAADNSETDKAVRDNLRFIDRDPSKDELFLGQDHIVVPWAPQVSWEEKGKRYALRVPTWKVEQALPVDLCFAAEIVDAKTGKTYKARTLLLAKGKTGQGYLYPDDVRGFARNHSGFVDVRIRLTPSRALAISEPAVTSYYPGTITSNTLRMKVFQGEVAR